MLSVAFAISASAVNAAPEKQAAPMLSTEGVSASQMLDLGEHLAVAGKIGDANLILDALKQNDEGSREQILLAGIIAVAQGNLSLAEAGFRTLLLRDPHDTRVRLELARVLFLLHRYAAADYHFRLSAARSPTSVQHNISLFRRAIQAQRTWRVSVEGGIAPDTNVNSAGRDRIVDLFGLPFNVDNDAREKSGVGVFANADVELRLRRSEAVGLSIRAFGNAREYRRSAFNDEVAGIEIGPQFRFGNAQVIVAGTGLFRWYGREIYSRALGAALRVELPISAQWQVDLKPQFRSVNYLQNPSQNGPFMSLNGQISRSLGSHALGQIDFLASRQSARAPGYAYREAGLGVSAFAELGNGITVGGSIEAARTVFDAPLFGFAKTRRDWRAATTISVLNRNWILLGFSPVARLSFARSKSTISFFEYRRTRLELALQRPF
ncbi:surface lipoprotein assembly modifier [Sphingobium indicum]